MRISKAVFCAFVFMFCAGIHAGAVNQSLCQPGSNVVYHPNGSLKSCILEDYFRADGFECNKQSLITFYEDGQLETCFLSRDATVHDQKCRQLGQVSFYPDGEFRSCVKQE